jgi:hypothetical protein
MTLNENNKQSIVELYYESLEKLERWCQTQEHDYLTSTIEAYFVKSLELEIMV